MYKKRPLIYIPRKKTVTNGGTPETEVLGAVYLTTSWCNAPTLSAGSNHPGFREFPQRVSYNPQHTNFKIGPADKDVSLYTTSYYYDIIPVRPNQTYSIKQVANMLRWLPIYPAVLTSTTSVATAQAFYIPRYGSDICKIVDSSQSYPETPHVNIVEDSLIQVDPELSLRKDKLQTYGGYDFFDKLETALTYLGYSVNTGALILVARYPATADLMTASQILSYYKYIWGDYFGSRNAVTNLDINI